MTPIALALLAAVALAPLIWTLWRRAAPRGRRESALALHRAQLVEIDRDLADGRISAEDHATAKLEIQRRLLAAAEAAEPEPTTGNGALLIAALIVIPLGAAGLYLLNGHPDMPAAPLAARLALAEQQAQDESHLIQQLRDRLAQLDPRSDQARQGYVLLGNVEGSRGNFTAAAQAWRTALTIRFDPTLAAEAAEAQTQAEGHVTPESAALFREALAAAPPDAPWRKMVENRLAEAK